MTMGLFFLGLGVTSIIQEYLASEDGKKVQGQCHLRSGHTIGQNT